MMNELNEGDVYEIKPFTGDRQILIVGSGEARIHRSLSGHNYPMTDESGEELFYGSINDDVILNSTLSNDCFKAKFSVECYSGEIKVLVIAND